MDGKKGNLFSSALIVGSGCFWGTIGIFTRYLGRLGLSTEAVVVQRCLPAALMFALVILFTDRSRFHVKRKDMWCFFGTGICALLLFTLCYFRALNHMSMSTAAILLYTAPCFVILMSAVLFKDRITKRLVIALVLAFAGCCLVSGIMGGDNRITLIGALYGLGSGIGYALYTIFSKFAMQRGYRSTTINFYSCLLAGLGALLFCDFPTEFAPVFSGPVPFAMGIGTAFVTCFMPYLLYTKGLEKVEAGKASIMASIEPVVATICGLVVFGETIDGFGILGILMVMSAIVLTNLKGKKS